MAIIQIPAPLRRFTQQKDQITCAGATLRETLQSLTREYPDLQKYIFDESDELQRFINIYVQLKNEENLSASNLDAKIPDAARIVIIAALAGG